MILDGDLVAIKTHNMVSSINLSQDDELEIKFFNGYGDLVIPLDPDMTPDNLMTVFYYYLENFKVG